MQHYLSLLVRALFVENMALAFFLGMCTLLAVSKRVGTAAGLGVAVTAVLSLSVPANNLIYTGLLKEGALLPGVDLSFLNFYYLYRRYFSHCTDFRDDFRPFFPRPLPDPWHLPPPDCGKLRYFRRCLLHGTASLQFYGVRGLRLWGWSGLVIGHCHVSRYP